MQKLLDRCENMMGPLSPGVKARINSYLDNPTEEGWADIHGLLIANGGMGKTLWQAWIAIDPRAPLTGRRWLYEKDNPDDKGIMTPWTHWPHPFTLRRAIMNATK